MNRGLSTRVRKILLPKDYLRFQLTGEYASDVSDASGTALFDVVNRRWSFELVDRLGLDHAILPRVFESPAVTGVISREAAAATGLQEGTPVVAGAGDQAASAVGNGIVRTGIVSCTIGTSGVVFAHMDQPHYDRARPRPYLLSCGTRGLARDGGNARRGFKPAVVS